MGICFCSLEQQDSQSRAQPHQAQEALVVPQGVPQGVPQPAVQGTMWWMLSSPTPATSRC